MEKIITTRQVSWMLALSMALAVPAAWITPADAAPKYAKQLLRLHNKERRKRGILPRLRFDARLMRSARKYAVLSHNKNRIRHRGPDGSSPTDRAAREGYVGPVAENLAINDSAKGAHKWWMRSSGHRAAILNKDLDKVGFGNKKRVYVAVFGFAPVAP